MTGLVGVIAQETSRFSAFSESLTSLDLPDGAEVKWRWGLAIPDNCNALVRYMYEQDHEWLWLLGDDHTFAPHVLKALLAHDKDIVVPLCLTRMAPYTPVVYIDADEVGRRSVFNPDEYPDGGLVQVHSAGSAGMLIRRRVFDALTDPWFETGQLSSVQLSEDLYFCDKASAEGAVVWCDLDTLIGHCFTGAVWPVHEAAGWTYGFSLSNGNYQIVVPPR